MSAVFDTYVDYPSIAREAFPCDGCAMFDACKARLLACRAFDLYTKARPEVVWGMVAREPTRETFLTIFASGERQATGGRSPAALARHRDRMRVAMRAKRAALASRA